MNLVKTSFKFSLQILSVFFVLIYILGVLDLYFSDRNNNCAMTYMFEYPQFVRISVPENNKYPGHYRLYAYSEGRFTERARKMWFDGIPVLFLPGNSGSHMQARSLASVALRMAISRETNFHFDYFTISFNEEMSGLFGGVLEKQTHFAAASINTILGLYKENKYRKSVPTSVILIGHSVGGIIAKRLLAHPDSIDTAKIAIALATPLEAPVVNFDQKINDFYVMIHREWEDNIRNKEEVKENKMLLSFGGGPRDLLVPSGLTTDKDSYINALTTSIPGVWVSTDHVSIVWCKQLVMAINRFLFSIVNPSTELVHENMDFVKSKARMYFESNRSMTLSPGYAHANSTMTPEAFWYEDNRRVYRISRPEINKMTYLMIRLVPFPQNRFAAIEAVNVNDRDWIFGCNAKDVYNMHRYCNSATSLSELSRWTGASKGFGKRKLATINLHSVMKTHPDWTHVIVKVSPTRKPVTLNVDVNDYASRALEVYFALGLSTAKEVIIQQTEPNSLYYEIKLYSFKSVQDAFVLYIEPTSECRAAEYHVTVELHLPWNKNHETYHYFTHEKKSPIQIRMFRSLPYFENLNCIEEPAKLTILLDPQCTFSVSVSMPLYLRLAQMVRHYSPVIAPYMGGILLLALRNTLINIIQNGVPLPVHVALTSRIIHPYFCLPFILSVTITARYLETWIPYTVNAGWNNREIGESFMHPISMSLIYMTALGTLYVSAAVIQVMLLFSSQITHRFFFRILWSGAANLAERVASGLQKVPLVVSFTLMLGVPFSCGAASLVVGAAFYAFMLSKTYEEYIEDYVYNIIVKFALRMFRGLVRAREPNAIDQNPAPGTELTAGDDLTSGSNPTEQNYSADERPEQTTPEGVTDSDPATDQDEELNESLHTLNFHILLFLMWLLVVIINIPALISWARSFNDSIYLKTDTSMLQGMTMSGCTIYLFQMKPPKKNLYSYNRVIDLLLFMALIIFILGPTALYLIGQVIAFTFMLMASQQMLDQTDTGVYTYAYFDDILTPESIFAELEKKKNLEKLKADQVEKDKVESVSGISSTEVSSDAATSSSTLPAEGSPAKTSSIEVSSDAAPYTASATLPAEGSSTKSSSAPSSSTSSTNNAKPADNPAQLNEYDEGSIMYKIKALKEKLSFLEDT